MEIVEKKDGQVFDKHLISCFSANPKHELEIGRVYEIKGPIKIFHLRDNRGNYVKTFSVKAITIVPR